jgi:TonB family protein
MIVWLNALADKWWPLFALHMLELALFIALIAAMERVLKLNVATRYALWLLALAKVFIPPVVALPAQLAASMPAAFLLPSVAVFNPELPPESPAMSANALLLCAWALSAVWFFGLMVKRHAQLRQRLRNATALAPFPNVSCAAFESEAITSPVLLGLFKPKLYLPREWREWPSQHLHSILQHEAAHLQSRDLFALVLEAAALVLFGLNPLVWLMARRLAYLRELRCDLAAMAHTGISALDYSKLLYAFAEKQTRPAMALATGITFAAQQSTLYQRLQHLLTRKEADMNANKFSRIALFGSMATAMLACSWQCSGPLQVDKAPLAPQTQTEAELAKPFDAPPEIITISAPKYPDEAKQARAQGLVFVQMMVDTEGNVEQAKVLKSRKMTESGTVDVDALGYGLEEAALAAARSCKFKPAKQDGVPVRVTIAMPFNFKLDNPAGALRETDRMQPGMDTLAKVSQAHSAAEAFQPYDQAPEMLSAFDLKYPELMRKAGIEGTVYLLVGVSAEGATESVVVAKPSGNESFDQAAIAAARVMKWKPAYYQGRPIAVKIVMPAHFKLSQ